METEDLCDVINLDRSWAVRPRPTIDRKTLTDAVTAGLNFLVVNQRKAGNYLYYYKPGKDEELERGVNYVRQAGTAWSVGRAARLVDSKAGAESQALAIGFLKSTLRNQLDHPELPYVMDLEAGRGPMGASALLCLSLVDGPHRDKHLELARRLARSIMTLQDDDGSLRSYFPPLLRTSKNQDYYPGEAMLAMMRLHRHTENDDLVKTVRKASGYYTKYYRMHPGGGKKMSFCPWQISAHWELYRKTRDKKAAEFVFEMADWLLTHQYALDAPWPDYFGGYAYEKSYMPGYSTATYSEGIVDAYRTAKSVGDEERKVRYRKALARAIPFIMSLQITPEDTYFMPRPERAVGGVRQSLASSSCRCDLTQHAMLALLKALEAFSDEELATLEADRKVMDKWLARRFRPE